MKEELLRIMEGTSDDVLKYQQIQRLLKEYNELEGKEQEQFEYALTNFDTMSGIELRKIFE